MEVGGIDVGDVARKAIVAVRMITTSERLLATHSIQCVRNATRLDILPPGAIETHYEASGKRGHCTNQSVRRRPGCAGHCMTAESRKDCEATITTEDSTTDTESAE